MNPDIPWAAGLFEGEGSILIAPPRNNRPGIASYYESERVPQRRNTLAYQ
jgi:hypothetical protein